jgi:hypothetical protein
LSSGAADAPPPTMPRYVEFDACGASPDLERAFLADLASSPDAVPRHLATLVTSGIPRTSTQKKTKTKRNPHKLKLAFFSATADADADADAVMLVMVTCYVDAQLIALANHCHFPRGFPIVWRRSSSASASASVTTFGFFPKFANDQRQTPSRPDEFCDCTALDVHTKWSGFLGQPLAFQVPSSGECCWTFCSKNSASRHSEFVCDGARLWRPFMPRAVGRARARDHWYVCAEMLSRRDQTHGARVLAESPVVTMLGQSRTFAVGVDADADGTAAAAATVTTGTVAVDDFRRLFDQAQSSDACAALCRAHGIPFSHTIRVRDAATIRAWTSRLGELRDFMTLASFRALCREFDLDDASAVDGAADHALLLGDVLEGLVLTATSTAASGTTSSTSTSKCKYKFSVYTGRTMLLRPLLESAAATAARLAAPLDASALVSARTEALIERFAAHWCVTARGRRHNVRRLAQCVSDLTPTPTPTPTSPERDGIVGRHILVADAVDERIRRGDFARELELELESESDVSSTDDSVKPALGDAFYATLARKQATARLVIVVLAPVACGKSTVARSLVELCGGAACAEHVDGDVLGLVPSLVLRMGVERNAYTLWRLVRCLMRGKIPVVSTGGGAFGSTTNLRESVARMLGGISIHLVVVTPDVVRSPAPASAAAAVLVPTPTTPTLEWLYTSDVSNARLCRMLADRLSSGEWTLPARFGVGRGGRAGFLRLMQSRSRKNYKYAVEFRTGADSTLTYPLLFDVDGGADTDTDVDDAAVEATRALHRTDVPARVRQLAVAEQTRTRTRTQTTTPTQAAAAAAGGRFRQFRWLVDYQFLPDAAAAESESESECEWQHDVVESHPLRHETIAYDVDVGLCKSIDEFDDARNIVVLATQYTFGGTGTGTGTVTLLVLPGGDGEHVTIDSGRHRPVHMRTLARHIQRADTDDSSIKLPIVSPHDADAGCTYRVGDATTRSVRVRKIRKYGCL